MKQTFVGGDIIETTGGNNLSYAKDVIQNAGSQVIQQGKDTGVTYGKQGSPPKNQKIYDVVMFVAGTTDPINIKGEKHQANTEYWQAGPENFWAKIKELKPQFLNLHIEGNFFSWSGDNDTKERNLAADRLLDLFLRVYKFWKNQEVHIHLIGHSHGGNVINQFTELISKSPDYPKPWKVKSITYLSTPFFHKKHQLNHAKLHPDCKIINVHNEYDLTQQLIADFSLVNLEVFLKNFKFDDFEKGLRTLKTIDSSAFDNLTNAWINDKTEGPFLWRETAKGLLGINQLTVEFIKYIEQIDVNKPNLRTDRDGFVHILNRFLQWTHDAYNIFVRNSSKRNGGYGRKEYFSDLLLSTALNILNELFAAQTGVKDSYILTLLARIFAESSGLTDTIEINSWSPKHQTKGLSVQDINITQFDPYHRRNKKAVCEAFINGTIRAMQNRNLEELLMRLFSQFVKPGLLTKIYWGFHGAEVYFTGETDTQIKRLRKSFGVYLELVKQYHANLVTEDDEKKIPDMIKRPGTVPYLAMASHSLSHTQFWPEVEAGLKGAFSSGANPGYKKK